MIVLSIDGSLGSYRMNVEMHSNATSQFSTSVTTAKTQQNRRPVVFLPQGAKEPLKYHSTSYLPVGHEPVSSHTTFGSTGKQKYSSILKTMFSIGSLW